MKLTRPCSPSPGLSCPKSAENNSTNKKLIIY
jgi:hypothetical protein